MSDEPRAVQQVPWSETYLVSNRSMQPGSRFAFGPVPCGMTFEIDHLAGGEEIFVYMVDTPSGVTRVGFPRAIVEMHVERLQRLLQEDPTQRLQIAREMPKT